MMATVLLVASFSQQPAADTGRGRPCVVEIDSILGKGQQVEVRKGETNVFARRRRVRALQGDRDLARLR